MTSQLATAHSLDSFDGRPDAEARAGSTKGLSRRDFAIPLSKPALKFAQIAQEFVVTHQRGAAVRDLLSAAAPVSARSFLRVSDTSIG